MASLNKVILIGHLTADPELKTTQTGVSVTSFSIGVTRRFTRAGEQPQSDFINIVAWRQTADFICKFFKKGNAICICGSIQTRSYDAQDGTKRYVTEVVADEATFVERKSDRGDDYRTPAFSSDDKVDQAPKFDEIAEDGDLPF
ncbi:MAG: single-stranded DNA-binding protein [Clostridia bacterium]|jgi:single-strand DNA-binding protein|nr:single-stranded DNA-binding protein [Clostridia bacterium]